MSNFNICEQQHDQQPLLGTLNLSLAFIIQDVHVEIWCRH